MNTIVAVEIVVATVDARSCTDRQRKDLLRALKYAQADPECVCSWLYDRDRTTITYTLVGPVPLIEAVKRAARAIQS